MTGRKKSPEGQAQGVSSVQGAGFGASFPPGAGAKGRPVFLVRAGLVLRSLAVLSLAAAAALFASCTITRLERPNQLANQKAAGKILNVQMKSGEVIEFAKGRPGYLDGDFVVGEILEEVVLDVADVTSVTPAYDKKTVNIVAKDGSTYQATSAEKKAGFYFCKIYSTVEIPVDDIQVAKVRRADKTANTILEGAALVAAITLAVILDPHAGYDDEEDDAESCPFIYSYDGERYVLDAEPYGTAVCEGLKRTEWAALDGLEAVGGEYRILLANELDETQYTDELKLFAVDHPAGVEVAPDLSGRLHTFSDPLAPRWARDQKGRDIRPLIAKNDNAFWLSRLEEKDPQKKEDMRDELTFEFAKPAGAERAKLLVNAWTTMWGSQVIRKFLEVRGEALPSWYADIDGHGREYGGMLDWQMREELYVLKVWVETKDGWKARSVIAGGGPYVSKSKAYVLDIGDVPGEFLRIRLRPPVNFWLLNLVAVDYGEDLPVQGVELSAMSAVDQDGRDVRAKLQAVDGDYLVAPDRGNRTDIRFAVPPLTASLERTVFLKATGYYDIHLKPSGPPQTDVLERIAREPGFAAQFALEEYNKWQKRLLARKNP